MADECKLCGLLGGTLTDSTDGNPEIHAQLHARQSHLISLNHIESTVDGKIKTVPINGQQKCARTGQCTGKKLSRLTLSRKLVDIHGNRNSGIECTQCKRSIRPQRRKAATSYNLISHACLHLNKELFVCRHCDFKFLLENGVRQHLRKVHSLSGIRTNYIDIMDDHNSEIMDMLNLCFGKAPQKQLDVPPFGKKQQNIQGQDPFVKLSYKILSKHQPGSNIKCNLCPSSIVYQKPANAARNILDHTRWHVDKPIFTCRLCQYSVSTEYSIRRHGKSSHNVAESKENFKNGSSEYSEEISSMLEDCFGEMKKEKERQGVLSKEDKRTRQAQSRIRSLCRASSLLAERQLRSSELAQRFHRSGKLQCRICHQHLTVVRAAKTNYAKEPMRHALAHHGKFLFTCRRCSHSTSTKDAMWLHLHSKHGVPAKNEFDDRTDDFHTEIMDMLSKCYDWDLEPEKSGGSISVVQPIVTPKIRILKVMLKMHGNDIKGARYIRANELIRSHSTDGKLVCRICSHNAKSSKSVLEHVMIHMERHSWPYHCKLCSHVSVRKACLQYHLKTVHKDNEAREFEDMSDKSHSEIMKVLSECYDWNVESGMVS